MEIFLSVVLAPDILLSVCKKGTSLDPWSDGGLIVEIKTKETDGKMEGLVG